MTSDPDRPGFNDLVTPFIFVRHGDPDPVAWKQAHPGWVSFPATFIPHKRPPPKWTILNGRRWPLDKRGQPWPRSRFGQPMCPLDEFPPGVPAPGTQGKLQEAQAAALRETVELVGKGELTVEWFLAEGARHRAERDARAAADPQPPLAYAVDGLEPAREYLAWSRHMNARGRGLAEAAGQRVGTADPHPVYDGDGLGVVREHLAMMGKVDAYLREFAEGARQRTAARLAAADGITDAAPAKLDATRASSKDEQPSPGAPNAAGRGPILSDTDGTATHLPDGTPLIRIADRRSYYGPDSVFMPGSPSNQAFVRGVGKAARALRDGPGFTPTPPLPPPAPFPIDQSQPRIGPEFSKPPQALRPLPGFTPDTLVPGTRPGEGGFTIKPPLAPNEPSGSSTSNKLLSPVMTMAVPAWIPNTVMDSVPKEWGEGQPNRKDEGWRWTDPKDEGNGVRIDRGSLINSQPSQQIDHVVVRYGGKVIGKDGNPIIGPIRDNAEQAHIPLEEYVKWRHWYKP